MRSDIHGDSVCGKGLSDIAEIHEPARPILETCPGRVGTSVPDLRERVVRHCSPTLAGLKCGSMFRVESDPHGILHQTREIEGMLRDRGVRVRIISFDGEGSLVYVYRPSMLRARIADREVMSFLEDYGYDSGNAEHMVDQLCRRFVLCPRMPPEVGVFLDYPMEDVRGYIENEGRCCRCIGCWKVYGDVEAAERTFRSYKRCRDVYCRLFSQGHDLARLAVRVRSEPAVQRPLLPSVRLRLAGGGHLAEHRPDAVLGEPV